MHKVQWVTAGVVLLAGGGLLAYLAFSGGAAKPPGDSRPPTPARGMEFQGLGELRESIRVLSRDVRFLSAAFQAWGAERGRSASNSSAGRDGRRDMAEFSKAVDGLTRAVTEIKKLLAEAKPKSRRLTKSALTMKWATAEEATRALLNMGYLEVSQKIGLPKTYFDPDRATRVWDFQPGRVVFKRGKVVRVEY